jgi:hypothetical protein
VAVPENNTIGEGNSLRVTMCNHPSKKTNKKRKNEKILKTEEKCAILAIKLLFVLTNKRKLMCFGALGKLLCPCMRSGIV